MRDSGNKDNADSHIIWQWNQDIVNDLAIIVIQEKHNKQCHLVS